MRVLITGGMGFVGSFLADRLVADGHDVTLFDNLDPQVHPDGRCPEHWNRRATFVQGDVRDFEQFKAVLLEGYDVVFHYAAMVGIAQSKYLVRDYVNVNTGGTANLLDVVANHRAAVGRLVVAASMSSYGEGTYACPAHGVVRPARSEAQLAAGDWDLHCPRCGTVVVPVPISEEAFPNADSIYAITKLTQEQMVLHIGRAYGVPAVALRFFNVYGPRQSLSNPYTGVSAIFMSRLKSGKPPVVYEDGQQSRDFVSVHDVVEASVLAMTRVEADGQAFNIGSGRPLTVLGLARKLAACLDVPTEPQLPGTFRKGDVRHCVADISRAERILGFRARVSIEDGLRELVDWSGRVSAIDRFEAAEAELEQKGLLGR